MVEQSGSKPSPLSYTDINRSHDGQWVLIRHANPKKFDLFPDGFVVAHSDSKSDVLSTVPKTRIPSEEYTMFKAHANFQKPTYEPVPELPPHLR